MNPVLDPTPYHEVNEVLADLANRIYSILGGQFLGMYLYGSLALGDFDPVFSDIDFLAVTEGEISDADFIALDEAHAQFAQTGSLWAERIEAAYIPREALTHAGPTEKVYPQLEKGCRLTRMPLEPGWAFQRDTLYQRGVVVFGPPPGELFAPVDQADMRQAAASILGRWLDQSRNDPGWIEWVREQGCLAFVVLTVCRLLYSLETGSVASKPAAARWAVQNLDRRWAPWIEKYLGLQHASGQAADRDLNEMLAFLAWALQQSQSAG